MLRFNKSSEKSRILLVLSITLLLFLAALFFVFLSKRGLGVPCVFRKITGLKCFGCGNTHAVISLLKGNLKTSLSYNLLYPLEFFYIFWVYFSSCKSYIKSGSFRYNSKPSVFDVSVLIIILIWGIIRNII